MKRNVIGLMAVCFILVFTSPASAFVIFSSYGPSDAYESYYNGYSVSYSAAGSDVDQGFSFVSAGNYFLDSIELSATRSSSSEGSSMDLWLMSDDNGLPGSLIEGFLVEDVPVHNRVDNDLLSVDSQLKPFLAAGDTYWLVGSASGTEESTIYWNQSDPGLGLTTNRVLRYGESQDWLTYSDYLDPAFRLNGTNSAVPEPATMVLLGTGLLGFVVRRRKA